MAQEASREVQSGSDRIEALSESIQKIGEVVNLIQDIAEQTNLLALNAAIEAARAGDAGKGFAVVASEVKSLASQSAQATDDIRQQIAAVQEAGSSSVTAIKRISEIIVNLESMNGAVASAVEQRVATTQEIATNIQVAIGSNEVSSAIATVADFRRRTPMTGRPVCCRNARALRTAQRLSTTRSESSLRMSRPHRPITANLDANRLRPPSLSVAVLCGHS